MHEVLLDTQVYLWALANSPKLSTRVRESIQDAEQVYVSAASIWEACIKISVGKLDASLDALVRGIEASGFVELPVFRHTYRSGSGIASHSSRSV
jgi:PIN domain nuclease of toxin-antitoxin system